jgi:GTPase-activating protein SAC7
MSPRDQAASRSTVSSGGAPPRKSFQEPQPLAPSATDPAAWTPVQQGQQIQSSSTDPVFSDSERERRGPMSWIRGKILERKDKEAEKRAKTPERNRDRSESKQDLRLPPEAIPVRGKSLDVQRSNAVATAGPGYVNAVGGHGGPAPAPVVPMAPGKPSAVPLGSPAAGQPPLPGSSEGGARPPPGPAGSIGAAPPMNGHRKPLRQSQDGGR